MADLHATASVPSAEAPAIPVSHSPTPASEPAREPLTDHAAYIAGLSASQAGTDLADLVFEAFASWPGSARDVCSQIASAAVGWCAAEFRRDQS